MMRSKPKPQRKSGPPLTAVVNLSGSRPMANLIDLEKIPSRDALELATLEALKSNQRMLSSDGRELTPQATSLFAAMCTHQMSAEPTSHHLVNFKDIEGSDQHDEMEEFLPGFSRRTSKLELPNQSGGSPEPDSSIDSQQGRYLLRKPTKQQLARDMDLEDLSNSGLLKRSTSSKFELFQDFLKRNESVASFVMDEQGRCLKRRSARLESIRSCGSELPDLTGYMSEFAPENIMKASTKRHPKRVKSVPREQKDSSAAKATVNAFAAALVNKEKKAKNKHRQMERVNKQLNLWSWWKPKPKGNSKNSKSKSKNSSNSARKRIIESDDETSSSESGDEEEEENEQEEEEQEKEPDTPPPPKLKKVAVKEPSKQQATNKKPVKQEAVKQPPIQKQTTTQDITEGPPLPPTNVLLNQLQAAQDEAAQAWQLVVQRDKELFSMRKVLCFMERKVTEIGEDLTLL